MHPSLPDLVSGGFCKGVEMVRGGSFMIGLPYLVYFISLRLPLRINLDSSFKYRNSDLPA